MSDVPITSMSTNTIDSIVNAIQKVGFPIVMCAVLLYIIYLQNRTNNALQLQSATNAATYAARLTSQDKDLADIKGMLAACTDKHTNP